MIKVILARYVNIISPIYRLSSTGANRVILTACDVSKSCPIAVNLSKSRKLVLFQIWYTRKFFLNPLNSLCSICLCLGTTLWHIFSYKKFLILCNSYVLHFLRTQILKHGKDKIVLFRFYFISILAPCFCCYW